MFKKDVLFIVPTVDRDLLGYAYIAYMLEKKYKLKAKIMPDINYIYLFHILLYAPNMVVSYQANTRHAEKVFKECKTKTFKQKVLLANLMKIYLYLDQIMTIKILC